MADTARTDSAAEVAAAIRKMGRAFNPDVLQASYALFKPLQERAPKDGVRRHDDNAYGPHPRQRLDLFVPETRPARPAPVVVYFHGGGYVQGERSPHPGLIYDNVATFFARHGVIGANATYPLAPEAKWPEGGKNIGRVVAWLKENVAAHGGDPDRIFVMGQSAGASHVASWAFDARVHGADGPGIAGAMLLSGVYATREATYSPELRTVPNYIQYFGEDQSSWDDKSTLGQVKAGHPPVYLCVTEFDPYPLAWPTLALADALTRVDGQIPVWFRVMRDNNHVSSALQINSEVDALGPDLLEFVTATH